ncbi:MAG: hypothetical protein FWF52_01220 [Candidatus Azobacteroides sp.]|nr:hypothetical protein [Candidatus Azobacteroides sp.]
MTDKQATHLKQVIEIADYIYSNDDKKMSDVLSYFAEKCGKSQRTVERWLEEANRYNLERIQKQEKIRDDILAEQTKEVVKQVILSRNRSLEILSNIAEGNARKVPTETALINGVEKAVSWQLEYPSDGDRTKAIQQIAKMEGWDAPTKTEISFPTAINFILDNGRRE